MLRIYPILGIVQNCKTILVKANIYALNFSILQHQQIKIIKKLIKDAKVYWLIAKTI